MLYNKYIFISVSNAQMKTLIVFKCIIKQLKNFHRQGETIIIVFFIINVFIVGTRENRFYVFSIFKN